MTTIIITTLQFQPAVEFAEKLQSIVSYAESLFGAVDIDFVVTPTVTAATYEAAMSEFDEMLAEVRKPGYTVSPSSDLEWQFGWSVFHQALPVGVHIRSNFALDGWKAARADALAVAVD